MLPETSQESELGSSADPGQEVDLDPSRASARTLVAAVLLSCAGVSWALRTPDPGAPGSIVAASMGTMLVSLAGLVFITRKSGIRTALGQGKLGPWSCVSTALLFGVASLTWAAPQTGFGIARLIAPESVFGGLMLITACQLTWLLGYALGAPTPVWRGLHDLLNRQLTTTSTALHDRRVIWTLFGVSLVGQAFRIVIGTFGYLQDAKSAVVAGNAYSQLVSLMSAFGDFALIAAAVHAFRREPGGRFALVTIASIQVVIGLFSGNKQPAVMVVVELVLAYAVTRRKFPVVFVAVGTVFFLLVVLPFVTAYRVEVRGQDRDLVAAVQTAPSLLTSSTGLQTLSASSDLLQLRIREIDNVAVVVQKTPEQIAYRPLREFAQAPLAGVIPRAIWSGKPVFATGYEFGQLYFYGTNSGVYTASAITPQGDLYRHGGWIVALSGMALIGSLTRLFDDLMQPVKDFRYLFFIVTFFPLVVKQEVDVVNFLVSMPGLILGPLLAVWVTGLFGKRDRGDGVLVAGRAGRRVTARRKSRIA